jgi:hypothetical protein
MNTMTGRRRHARYMLTEPMGGTLRVREEVVIESSNDSQIVVLSTTPSRQDETLTLELPGVDPRHVVVKVAESRPVVGPNGALQHRLLLLIQPRHDDSNGRHAA